jgi:photosynthetic reaction center cytochrome c subunit
MINMSQALGVNCTSCPTDARGRRAERAAGSHHGHGEQYGLRSGARHSTRTTRAARRDLPANDAGSATDAPKIACITCHQGRTQPLGGAEMAQHYPALLGEP